MRRTKRRFPLATLLAAMLGLTLLLAACGGEDEDLEAAPDETEEPEEAPSEDADTEEDAPDDEAPTDQPDKWVIGWINPLSGAAATFGELSRNAAEMKVEEINAAGGINGIPLEVVFEDNELSPEASIVAAERLIGQGVNVILSAGSSVIFALDPIGQQNDVLIANHAAQSPQLLPPGTSNTYNFIPTSASETERLAELVDQELGLSNVAIIEVDNDYGQDTADAFVETFEALGGNIVAREIHDVGASDMRTQLIQIANADPEAVVFVSNITEVGHAVDQAREVGIDAQFLGLTFSLSPDNFEIAGDAMEGMRGVAITFNPDESSLARDFTDEYEERFGGAPTIYAATTYDAIGILAQAIEETGTDDASVLAEYLVGLSGYQGVLGPTSMDDTRTVEIPLFEWVIEGGEAQPW